MACPPPYPATLARTLQRTGACHPTPNQLITACGDSRLAAHTFGHSLPTLSFHGTASPAALVPACFLPARAALRRGALPTATLTPLLNVRSPLDTPVPRTPGWLPRGIAAMLCFGRPATTTLLAPPDRLSPKPLAASWPPYCGLPNFDSRIGTPPVPSTSREKNCNIY